MEALGQMTGGVAHEFNNLLQAAMGNLQLLEHELRDNAASSRRVRQVLKTISRGSDLTYRLLSYTGGQFVSPKVIDMGSFLDTMSDLIVPLVGQDIEVEITGEADLWRISADPGQLEATILDLAINARDAMNGMGKLTLSGENIHLESVRSLSRSDEAIPGDYVTIAVSDTGTGMTDEVKARAFDPFFTTKEVGQGTGLGLSMVYGFIRRQCGGFIDIDSAPDKGTTIRIYLPRAEAPSHAEKAKGVGRLDAADGRQSGDLRPVVLVAEDSGSVLAVTTETLKIGGWSVLEANNGPEALALAGEQDRLDVLLTDIVMHGMNGMELAKAMREKRPDIKVVYMSGHSDDVIAEKGNIDGPILRKPFSAKHLLDQLSRLMNGAAAKLAD